MMTLLVIEQKESKKIFRSFLGKFFQNSECWIYSSEELNFLIESENPDFIYVNVPKPVDGDEDMMNMLRYSDDYSRLRVTLLKLKMKKDLLKKITGTRFFYKVPPAGASSKSSPSAFKK